MSLTTEQIAQEAPSLPSAAHLRSMNFTCACRLGSASNKRCPTGNQGIHGETLKLVRASADTTTYAFTEHGALMLGNVLRSDRANAQ